ncbi:hypothetical protein E2I00_014118, partial [Balaenoptera physalus]
IHGWDSDSDTAIFLKPWSKGNFSDAELIELEDLFRAYFIGFTQEVQDYASKFQIEYPFVIQGIAGCELHSGKSIRSFLRGALGGLDFMSIKNHSCAPAPEGSSRAQQFCSLISQYQGILGIIETLLSETCPRYLLGVLDAGKTELQRQDFSISRPATFFEFKSRRSPHLRQLDILGNISALLGPFDMSCIMVFEALVLSEYLMSPHHVSISIWDQ